MGKMRSFGIRTQMGLTVLMMSSDRDDTESTDPHPAVFVLLFKEKNNELLFLNPLKDIFRKKSN